MSRVRTIKQALDDIKKGKALIIVDDPSRENQGDLFIPAEIATKEIINLMIMQCRGLVCAPVSQEIARKLDIPLMVEPALNTETHHCNFTVSVDAKSVTAYGISATDRLMTVKALQDPSSQPTDFVRPGHIFPIIAKDGGVLERQGHTEAAVAFAELAGFQPCAVICEILNDDGEPAAGAELTEFAEKFNVGIVAIQDLVDYVRAARIPSRESTSTIEVASANLPTSYGTFKMYVFKTIYDNREHSLLLYGDSDPGKPLLTRIHSQCFTGDTLSSLKCDCNEQLHMSLRMIQETGRGALVYLNQEGRGIGLGNKIKAYALQDKGYDTIEANHMLGLPTDARNYQVAAEMLQHLGITNIDLMTNNPEKLRQLKKFGIKVHKMVPIETPPNEVNIDYLTIKKRKLGHRLTGI